ncbi:MAG: flavodoxin family protein [Firmicutes bacterium]|nr:flavodoxin family protein [Bacillota bacterium]
MKAPGSITIFRASPRKKGNTNALTDIVAGELYRAGKDVREFDLYDMDIRPCLACRKCQEDWSRVTCSRDDDMGQIFQAIGESDLLILASPVYSWYCTPPMKAMLDRLVYAMNMYYGEKRGPSLWAGKSLALITSCGYPPEKGADLLEEGIRRYCRHSQLNYRGMLCGRHMGYSVPFMDDDKKRQASLFAKKLMAEEEDEAR